MNKKGITAKDFKFIWEISNFSSRCKTVGEKIVSPIFTPGDLASDKIQWQLHLYPFGDKDVNKDYLSIFLYCTLSDDIFRCEARINFDLWNTTTDTMTDSVDDFLNLMYIFSFSTVWRQFGDSKFIVRNSQEIKNHLASSGNDTLCIECYISNINVYYANESTCCVELIRGFDAIFLSENLSDVTIEVDNKTLKAHKIILSARSEVFSAMFKHNTIENNECVIKIIDISYNVMKEVLRFIYCGKVQNLDYYKTALLAAADKYNLVALKNCCEEAFWKNFSIDNICEILRIADLYKCDKLKIGAINFIIKNIKIATKTSKFFETLESNNDLLIELFCETVLKKSSQFIT